jgi:hypothetical protein
MDKTLGMQHAGDVAPSGPESIAQHVRHGARTPKNAFVWEDNPLPGHVRPKSFQRTAMVPSKRPPQPVPYQV